MCCVHGGQIFFKRIKTWPLDSCLYSLLLPQTECLCPLKILCRNLNPQYDSLVGGHWEMIRSWAWRLMNKITVFIKRDPRQLPHPYYHVRTQQEDDQPSINQESGLHRHRICWNLDLRLQISVVCKPPGLCMLLQQPEWTKTDGH